MIDIQQTELTITNRDNEVMKVRSDPGECRGFSISINDEEFWLEATEWDAIADSINALIALSE